MVYQEGVKNEALILLLEHEVVLKVVLRSGLRERFYWSGAGVEGSRSVQEMC
jgi:hypothetical protein